MKKILAILLFLSGACFAQIKKEDPVKIDGIPFPLTWKNSPVSYKVDKNSISITAGKETDFYSFLDGRFYTTSAPKIVFPPDSNFIFSVRIKPDFKNVYDGGAILLYADDQNWAKALFEMHNDKSVGLGVSVVDNKHGDDSYHGPVTAESIYVKVAKSDNVFNFYRSADGKTWTLTRSFPFVRTSPIQIGFYAQSPKGESCTVLFSEIVYKGVKFQDYTTGE